MTQNTESQEPIITVSESAADALKSAAENAEINIDDTVVRVSLQQDEDSISHQIGLEPAAAESDYVFQQHGLTLVVSEELAPILTGAHFDYAVEGGEAQLVVSNPNLTTE